MDSKTGTGLDAVNLALENRWEELGAYCRQDTLKTHAVSSLPRVRVPVRGYPDLYLEADGTPVIIPP